MNKAGSVCIAVFFPLLISAQSYHPTLTEDKTWDVFEYNFMVNSICGWTYGYHQFVAGDTTINGIDYMVIRGQQMETANGNPPFCDPFVVNSAVEVDVVYMREDTAARQVFIYNTNLDIDDLAYDFNLLTGDTLHSETVTVSATIVDSVRVIDLLNGEQRNVWHLNSGEEYVEGIGGSTGLGEILEQAIGGGNVLRCARSLQVALYPWDMVCPGFLSIPNEPTAEAISLYPNPSSGNVFIDRNSTNPLGIEIHDLRGQLVYTNTLRYGRTVLDLNELPAGFYFWKTANGSKGKLILTD